MSDAEQLTFKIGLSGTSLVKSPQVRISVDDNVFVESTLSTGINNIDFFEFSADLVEGAHELTIELLNKLSSDTKLDNNGNIVEDMLLNIDSIEIDNIEIASLKWSESIYNPIYPDNYLDDQQKSIKNVKNCVTLGWNGTWKLHFQSPYYLWLLEKF